jgi:hypothetical protein
MPKLTAETITLDDLYALRREAHAAGDSDQIFLVDCAIGRQHAVDISRTEAVLECVNVINQARGCA